ncbi:MAG: hypothetical protein H8E34_14475 [Bacteroidetes bacterium]|nr:hypothetical protein [Bacteroidota bacterium]MBL6944847.1 hypothetical protein [Bacteroidales bacterium]
MKKVISYIILLLFLSTSCIDMLRDNDSPILARVQDKYLYVSDIQNIIPGNISPRDSIAFIRSYVIDWVRTNVMIYQAQQNLPENQLDFSKRLEDYRNSLIIYQYETSLINQSLDTIVTEEEIQEYYDTHLSDFELKENITKAVYVIIDDDPEIEEKFDQIFIMPDTLLFDSLEYYSHINVISSYLDTTKWVSFYNIQQIIPIETYNRELFLKNNRFVKINTEPYTYFVKFIDFKIKDDISPLDFKRNDIYNIIISRRKVKLAKKVRNDIYDRALKNNEFEIYYN